ncbi:MAG: TonB-dependent receptor [Bacteroidia bacterium]|nr:TonB-dependent receptor [Bacteroidia bacterium]
MRYTFTFLSFLFFLSNLYSQTGTLKGSVKDQENGEPLAGTTVFIIGTYSGTYTDERGNFEIKGIKPGDYSVKFSYVGYAEKIYNGVNIPAGGSTELVVAMPSSITTLGEVEIVGQKTLIDLESGKSSVKIGQEEIAEMSVKNVQEIAALQVGVNLSPDGIQIRGGRIYETEYLVDGINAQDPLAGTGFGVDVGAGAVNNVEVITGGTDAEFGNGSSGVILTRIREGGKQWNFSGNYRRDNLGFRINEGPSWNTDEGELSFGGPIIRDKLTFFTSGNFYMSDDYFRAYADQLHSSLFTNDSLWAPRQDNRWSHTLKLAWTIRPGLKLTLTNQHSLNINQSTRSLQIVGNDAVVTPGFQFPFSLDMDNANTYTHSSNLSVLNLRALLTQQWTLDASAGRLFTSLRVDANGRPFRSETVDQLYDPASIVTDPVAVFNPAGDVVYVFPGPGLVNNGGIATRWHDHYVEEYTLKTKFTFQSKDKVHYLSLGQEHKEQQYQWIDVEQPWVGAPIKINDTLTTPSTSLGSSSDFWKARPGTGGFFVSDEIQYKGIIANIGLRLNYWAPGNFVDDAVENPSAPVLDAIRQSYQEQTFGFAGRRWKARLLPRLRVSFPVTENNVLYFNYSHAMRLPHPRFVYAGLDPVYQDRSFLSNLGNPNLNPEVTVSYEVGLKSQLTKDLALTVTAFYNDKFDYIVSRRVEVRDQTGRFVEKTFYINQDYARIRGLELGLTRRVGKWLTASLTGSYQIATGKSNTAAESALQIRAQGFVNTTKEQYLAWDRPLDVKFLAIIKPDESVEIKGVSLKGFRLTVSSTFKSGLRYTPHLLWRVNDESGRPEFIPIADQPYAKVGSPWFWTNAKLSRDFHFSKNAYLALSFEVENITNYKSAAIVNGVTGKGYEYGDPLPLSFRDPIYPDPQDRGLPPENPARYLTPRHFWFGAEFGF